jgi:oligopeptide transport system permease protein
MRFAAYKISYALLALWIIVSLTFLLLKNIPGDPFAQEQSINPAIHQALLSHYRLTDPWHVQYIHYLKAVFMWDLGPSYIYRGQSVNQIISENFPISAVLGLEALSLAVFFGMGGGILAAKTKGSRWDKAILFLSALGVSIPSFILAALLQYTLAYRYPIFPIARWGTLSQSILPALSLAALPAAFIFRLTRTNLFDVLQHDYIKTARAKGLSDLSILFKHALRNAILPVLGYLGPLAANILTGSFVVEKIFAIPGLGFWFISSVSTRDYPVIMGTTIFYSLLLLTFVLLADLLGAWIDPRLRNTYSQEFT